MPCEQKVPVSAFVLLTSDLVYYKRLCFFAVIAMITCTLETIQLSPGESQSCAPLPARRNSSVVCPRLFLHCRRFSFPALPKKGGVRRTKLTEFVGPFLPQLIMPYVGIHLSLQISLRGIKQTWRDLAFGNRFQQW
jgi:hypothetical protein